MPTFEQPTFDFVIPNQPWFRIDKVAQLLDVSVETAWRLWDSGQIGGCKHNTRPADKRKRWHIRVARESIIAYLCRSAKAADFDAAQQLQWAKDAATPLNRSQTQALISHLQQQLYHR